jgi:2-C-methyl-D-erythritol 2,4-cyclodiphosphate synthase
LNQDLKKNEYNFTERVTGIGYDSHKFSGEKGKLILGGVCVSEECSVLAHSDGDALIHAIIDAILGASGLLDIGNLFSNMDPQWKNVSSLKMLAMVFEMIQEKNIKVSYIDCVVILEKPKLSNFIDEMKKNIAEALNIRTNRVNIKAKTNEGLGFLGRKEGLAALCNVTVERSF